MERLFLPFVLAFLATITGIGAILCYLNWRVLHLLGKLQPASAVSKDSRKLQMTNPEQPLPRADESQEPSTGQSSAVIDSPEKTPAKQDRQILQATGDMLKRKYAVRSEVNQRENNEDSFQVYDLALGHGSPGLPILAIADGMGGHAHGEHVSRETLRKVSQSLFDQLLIDRSINQTEEACPIDSKTLLPVVLNAFQQADAHVRRMVEVNRWGKAGSTLVMAIILTDAAVVANLGDSPLFHYQLRDGRLTQVTEDHTVAGALLRGGLITSDMAQVHEGRSRLEFFIGSAQFPKEPPVHCIALAHGDLILLCSDGVSGHLSQTQITQILTEGYGNLERQADHLLKAALEAGETDNQTLILWQYSLPEREQAKTLDTII